MLSRRLGGCYDTKRAGCSLARITVNERGGGGKLIRCFHGDNGDARKLPFYEPGESPGGGPTPPPPVIPAVRSEAMQRSHRTGAATCATSNSENCWPEFTSEPSLFVQSGSDGS